MKKACPWDAERDGERERTREHRVSERGRGERERGGTTGQRVQRGTEYGRKQASDFWQPFIKLSQSQTRGGEEDAVVD